MSVVVVCEAIDAQTLSMSSFECLWTVDSGSLLIFQNFLQIQSKCLYLRPDFINSADFFVVCSRFTQAIPSLSEFL